MDSIHIEHYLSMNESIRISNCICVLGVLNNNRGQLIKTELLNALQHQFNVLACIQEPPGLLYEYPAINLAVNVSIKYNTNVLYIHTKGAGNAIPTNYPITMMNSSINYPRNAKPEDCQKIVRLMWMKEFTTSKIARYLEPLNTTEPTVTCPYVDKSRVTWQNAWIINPPAAKVLQKSLHVSNNRYYYEQMFCKIPQINIRGIVIHSNEQWSAPRKPLWDSIWSYYDESISSMV